MHVLLPQAKNAAICNKNVYYNISGLFLCTDLIIQLIKMIEDKFEYTLPIKYIFGSPNIKWNGGRFLYKYSNKENIGYIEKEIIKVTSQGIIPLFTFSNSIISEKDLTDSLCNTILELINTYKAEVIVSSDLLTKYISIKYPNIHIHSSVIRTAFENNRDIEFYTKLSSEFSNYVIHPDDNFDIKLLSRLPRTNAEILLNDRCNYLCRLRSQHYLAISRDQRMQEDTGYRPSRFLEQCTAIPEYKQISTKNRNISLTVSEFIRLTEMGYTLFKIQGRTDSLFVFFFDLLRYTLENEIAFPSAYTIFSTKIEDFIKNKRS